MRTGRPLWWVAGLSLSLLLAAGDHYVRFENPLRATITFRVTLRYLILV